MKQYKPKFSVLINNFNYAKFLEESITSVLKQKFKAFEIIVVDDGSTDDSLIILEEILKKTNNLKVISQKNCGQLAAMRTAVNYANGDWCCFLDSDDTWQSNHLSEAASILENNEDVGFYYSDHKESEGPSLYHSKWPAGSMGPCSALIATTGARIGTITSALIVRKNFANKALNIAPKYDTDWKTRADDCLVFGAGIAGAIYYYNNIITVNYRVHGSNCFAGKNQDKYKTYLYDLNKWRLITEYCNMSGLIQGRLFKTLIAELADFNHHKIQKYVRRKYLNAIRKTPCGIGQRLKFICRKFRGKYS
jgi:glycosyltransferase involved in cell wall biosynthesis